MFQILFEFWKFVESVDNTIDARTAESFGLVLFRDMLEFAAALVSLKMETPGPFKGSRRDVLDYIEAFYR